MCSQSARPPPLEVWLIYKIAESQDKSEVNSAGSRLRSQSSTRSVLLRTLSQSASARGHVNCHHCEWSVDHHKSIREIRQWIVSGVSVVS